MAQHDFVIDNAPGLTVRTDMQAALQAVVSCSMGEVAPATPYAGQLWLNTSGSGNGFLQIRNKANTAWTGLTIDADGITGLPTPTAASATTTAANKAYVDNSIAAFAALGDDNILIYRASPTITLRREAADQFNQLIGRDEGNKLLWNLVLGYSTSKNFRLNRYDSNGSFVDSPFYIDWAAGKAVFDNGIIIPTGGVTITSGGLTIDSIVQKQASSTQTLYQTLQNSSGYAEWQWRMDGSSKQFELRAFDGSSAQTYLGASLSFRSSDGAVTFGNGVYSIINVLVGGEGVALKAPGATDSPYYSFYQGATRRGYFQYYNGTGLRIANDVTHDFLTILNAGGVDMLQMYDYTAADYYPVLHHGNAFFAGTTRDQTVFPIGSILLSYMNNVEVARNAAVTPRLDTGELFRYTHGGSGAALAGSWRSRGQHSDALLVQRVA